MTAVSKVTLNGTTLMDATSATASANEIISPYTAMTADGVMTTGTASGGGATKTVNNIFGNSASIFEGYLTSDGGSIHAQTGNNKEITTDFIDIEPYRGVPFWIVVETSYGTSWGAYVLYDSNKNIIGYRITFDSARTDLVSGLATINGIQSIVGSLNITPSNTAKYIRITCRTFGNAKIYGILNSDVTSVEYFSRQVVALNVLNPIESDGTAS